MTDTADKAQGRQGLKSHNPSKQRPQQDQKLLKPVPILPHQQPQNQLQQHNQQVPHQQPEPDHAKLPKLFKKHPVIQKEAPHQQLQNQPQKPPQNHCHQHSQNCQQPQHPDQLKNEKVLSTPRVPSQSSPRNLQPHSQQKPEEQQQPQKQDQAGDNFSYVPSVGRRKDLVGLIVGGRYRIRSCIGNGSFGELYRATNLRNGDEVAVKLESSAAKYPMLMNEARIYQVLKGGVGFPRMHHRGTEGEHNVLVLDLLGPSLEELLNFCSRSFSTKTMLLLADQILDRVEFLHINCIIHRDIKPDNFLMGLGRHRTEVFLIDFGLAKKYYSTRRHQHIAYSEDNDLVGTARYSSIHSHYAEQSRRDDLEAVGYMFLYLLRGTLPWQGIRAQTQAQKHERIAESKVSLPLNILCSGVPIEFYLYLHYCRGLRFQEEPNYGYLRHLFKSLYRLNFLHYDFVYDWMRPMRERKRLELNSRKREKKANKWYHRWDSPLITFKYPKVIRQVIRYRGKDREQNERDVDRDRETNHGRSIDGDRSEERNKCIIIHKYKGRDNDVDNHFDQKRDRNIDKEHDKERESDRDRHRFIYRSRDKEPCIYEDMNRCKCKFRDRNRSEDKDEYREKARYSNRGKCRDRNTYRERDNERGAARSQHRERLRNLENARNTDCMRYRERNREMDRTAARDTEKCRSKERYRSIESERYRKGSREKDGDREGEKDKHRLRDRDRERVRNLHREKDSRDRDCNRTKDRRAFSYDSTRYPKPLGDHQVMMQTERR